MKKYLLLLGLISVFTVISAENTTISGQPTVITTTTTQIVRANGQTNTVQTSASKLLPVQTSEITVIKSNGQTYKSVNVGQPIGKVVLTQMRQKRIQLADVIVQGGNITVGQNNKIFVDGQETEYVAPANYNIYTVTVWASNGQPTAILYDSTDIAGATNEITYYMNGVNTGVSARCKITQTLTTAGGQIVSGSSITTQNVNGTVYYFIDGTQTEYTPTDGDNIVDTYQIVDPISENVQYVKNSQSATVYRANGDKVLQSVSLSTRNISTITKNGQTLTGQLSAQELYIVTKGNTKFIGRAVYVKNGYIYVDGTNTNLSSSDTSVNTITRTCYIVKNDNNQTLTDIEYSAQDSITSKIYYVDNNTLTNIQKLDGDNLIKYDSATSQTNKQQNPIWTIVSSNKTYNANKVESLQGKKIIKTNGTNLYYKNTKQLENIELVYNNGTLLGKKSDAFFYTITRSTVTNGQTAIYDVNLSNTYKLIQPVNQYYLPRFDGYYFVANNKIYQNTGISASVVNFTKFPYSTYSMLMSQGAFVLMKDSSYLYLTAYEDFNQGNSQPTTYDTNKLGQNWGKYSRFAQYDLKYQNSIIFGMNDASVDYGNGKGRAHCVNCFNNATPGTFKSLAGYPGYSCRAMGVTTDGKMKMGQGHLNYAMGTDTNWQEVYLVGPETNSNFCVFIARNSNNQVFYIKSYNTYTEYKIEKLNIKATKLGTNRKGTAYAINGKILYKLIFTDTYTKQSVPSITTSLYSLNYNAKDIAVGANIIGILTENNKLYVCSADCTTRTLKDLVNVTSIGTSAGSVLALADGDITTTQQVPVIKINNKQYDISDCTFSTVQCYKLDGQSTNTIAQASDTEQNFSYYRLTLLDNKQADIQPNSISSYTYKNTITASDSGVLGYISTNNQGKYVINGNETNQTVQLTDKINVDSRKTYYIGDINTNIQPKTNDNISIKGDYWTINGYNTAVTFYGGKELVIQVSDVTPGEVTQDETVTASTVVVPLIIKGHISRFDDSKPITQIRLQFRRINDKNWTNLKILTNQKKSLETKTKNLESFFGRYVNVPVSKSESFILRCNVTDGTTSTVTASSLNIQQNNMFYWYFIRSQYERPNK